MEYGFLTDLRPVALVAKKVTFMGFRFKMAGLANAITL